jgi:hypothetical protein
MNVALGSVGVAASTRPEVADGFAPYQSVLDLLIVRVLAPHDATSLGTGRYCRRAGERRWLRCMNSPERGERERKWPKSRAEPRGPAGPR